MVHELLLWQRDWDDRTKKRIATNAMPASSRSDAVRFALREPAVNAVRFDLRYGASLSGRKKLAGRLADRSEDLRRRGAKALALKRCNLNPAPLYDCDHRCYTPSKKWKIALRSVVYT